MQVPTGTLNDSPPDHTRMAKGTSTTSDDSATWIGAVATVAAATLHCSHSAIHHVGSTVWVLPIAGTPRASYGGHLPATIMAVGGFYGGYGCDGWSSQPQLYRVWCAPVTAARHQHTLTP